MKKIRARVRINDWKGCPAFKVIEMPLDEWKKLDWGNTRKYDDVVGRSYNCLLILNTEEVK